MKGYGILFAFVLTSLSATAQENEFTLDAQLRTRAEYNNGAIAPRLEGEMPANFINERARLSMGWKRENLELKASLQHTGVWGQDDIKDRNGQVAMNEAWFKYTSNRSNNYYVQIGRQKLSYDDERLLGGLDWNVAGNWHNAIRTGYDDGEWKMDIVYAYNQDKENERGGFYAGPMPYKHLGLVWAHYDAEAIPLSLSLLNLSVGREAGIQGHGKIKFMNTLGFDLSFRPTDFDIHGAFYYQYGKNAQDTKVAAWMATAKVGYTINPVWKVNAGYDYLSGNDGGDKVKAFDALFGTHHKFYGSMDFFPGKLYCGLQDIQAGVSAQPSKVVNLQLNYHYFLTAQKVGDMSKGLGHEFDLQLTAKLKKDVTLMAGYSTMLGTETMDVVKGGYHKSWQDWAWVQLNINPRILFTKW